MARSSDQISQAMRANLRVLDPDINTEPLTPERKILDTVAEAIAEAEVDNYVLDYQYDIDTKIGSDLDKFVALFGFARQGGRQAVGIATFSRSSLAESDIIISAGTQVVAPATSVSQAVIFQTTTAATMYIGTDTVDVPIRCTVEGNIGNVVAHQITTIGAGITDISEVDNNTSTSGGSAEETDSELRIRFKNTVFRNIAGTGDQYLALAISSRFAKKANVIGPISRFIEYLQIINTATTTTSGSHTLPQSTITVVSTTGYPSSGAIILGGQTVFYTGKTSNTFTGATGGVGTITTGTTVYAATVSQIPYSKYTYKFDYYLTDGDPVSETFYEPKGVDYTFIDSVPATFNVNNSITLPSNTRVLLEHSYTSINSRNDPATNVLNYVDVYVSGSDPTNAFESALFPAAAANFVSGSGTYGINNWKRATSGATPTIGNRLQELLWNPIDELPGTITIGSNTYTLNTHYWLVQDKTIFKGSRRSRDGIEWSSAVTESVGTVFLLEYTFDKLPLTLNELMDSHKQIASDILVHQATNRYYELFLTIMYTPGFSSVAVDATLTTTITDFLEKQNFGAVIQFSDILEVAHQVPGVDNIRFTTSVENGTNYGMREVSSAGVNIGSPIVVDFALPDSDLPVLYSITTLPKSQNTWPTF